MSQSPNDPILLTSSLHVDEARKAIADLVNELLQEAQSGSLAQLPDLPGLDAQATAHYIQRVVAKELPVPAPIACQVECILHVLKS